MADWGSKKHSKGVRKTKRKARAQYDKTVDLFLEELERGLFDCLMENDYEYNPQIDLKVGKFLASRFMTIYYEEMIERMAKELIAKKDDVGAKRVVLGLARAEARKIGCALSKAFFEGETDDVEKYLAAPVGDDGS